GNLLDGGDGFRHRSRVAHVGGMGMGHRPGFGSDAFGGLFDSGEIAGHEMDVRARAGQPLGDGVAQSPAGPGHHRALSLKPLKTDHAVHHLPPRSSGFSTGVTFKSRLMPRARPISTLPGPTSKASAQPRLKA